jgi:hypothetical protein
VTLAKSPNIYLTILAINIGTDNVAEALQRPNCGFTKGGAPGSLVYVALEARIEREGGK